MVGTRDSPGLSWQRQSSTELQTPTLRVTSYQLQPGPAHSYLVPTLGFYALLVLADMEPGNTAS